MKPSRLAGTLVLVVVGAAASARAQTQQQLLAGASTDVPASANAHHPDLIDGSPLHVVSGFTGVEFHLPGKVSGLAPPLGGYAPTPQPIVRKTNGVEYWFVSGELSGYLTDDFGFQFAIGPIDKAGVNHRYEVRDLPGAHPRAGLPGAFFALMVPKTGFNGGLVQMQPPNDGGFFEPAGVMTWNVIDAQTLLARGYAVFMFGHGGSVHRGTLPASYGPLAGTKVIDTNPYSGSGIFWTNPAPADWENLGDLVVANRLIRVNPETGADELYPEDFERTFWDAYTMEWVTLPFGHPAFFLGPFPWIPELISDSVLFARNLVKHGFAPRQVTWAVYAGWSGSGRAATLIASNTRDFQGQVPSSAGPQQGGGNFKIWGQPSSGLRFDAFVNYAGANDMQGYLDRRVGQMEPNPKLPVSAPFVWLVPDADLTLPMTAAYTYANNVWRALDELGRGDEINDYLRIYSIERATHASRDYWFAPYDHASASGGTWYDYRVELPNPGSYRTHRPGLRVSHAAAERVFWNGGNDDPWWDFTGHALAGNPPQMGLWLQTFANLRRLKTHGVPLPVSRVDPALFTDPDALDTETMIPDYPLAEFPFPDPWDDAIFFAEVVAFAGGITEDTGIDAWTLEQHEVDELHAFAYENPLARSVRRLAPPDVALPLGTRLYLGNDIFQVPFSPAEFRARYHSRAFYVARYAIATAILIGERMWDPVIGGLQIAEVAAGRSAVVPRR